MTQESKKPVEERVAMLEGSVDHLSIQMTTMAKDMKHGFETLVRGAKPQWSPVIAFAAILLAVGGAFFAFIRVDLGRLESQAGSNAALQTDGTRALDVSLQREMRDLDRVAATALKAQRELLQTEMQWIKAGLKDTHEHSDDTGKTVREMSATLRENSAMIDLIVEGKLDPTHRHRDQP